MNKVRLIIGILVWLAILVVCSWGFYRTAGLNREMSRGILTFVTGKRTAIELDLQNEFFIAVGDPIFDRGDNGEWIQIGEISRLDPDDEPGNRPRWTSRAKAVFYAGYAQPQSIHHMTCQRTPDSIMWVVKTMFPRQTREDVALLISAAYLEHHREIFNELRPVIEDGFREAAQIAQQDLRDAIENRRVRIQEIGDRYQQELVVEELVPLVQDVVWPIVQRHAEPLARKIGQQLWNRASLWRFGWRMLYDASLLPQQDLMQKEFARFVNREGVPIVERHIDEIVRAQQRIMADVSRNEEVREAVGQILNKITNDPELQVLVTEIVREVFVDNPRLKKALINRWNSADARAALSLTNDRLDPTIVAIGQRLFGSPDGGITPEFAKVLRSKVLFRDLRWLQAHRAVDESEDRPVPATIPVRLGAESDETPFYYPVDD